MGLKSTPEEQLLIKECLEGNRKSQKAFYDLYSVKLYKLCLNYSKETALAEDILQEVFIKLFNNLHKYRGDGPFSAWVRKVAVNTAIEYIRRNRKLAISSLDEDLPFVNNNPSALDNLYAKDLINSTHSLSKGYKQVFNLYVVEGFSHKEIAQKFDITESTSKSQFCRAKNILRELVAQAG
jgi:RNA polymerase sigma factor (sigma-70 family)